MDETEQNKTEEATPHKLKRAREKGNVARGVDLGFFASLCGFMGFAAFAGAGAFETLKRSMQLMLSGVGGAHEPAFALALTSFSSPVFAQLGWLCATLAGAVFLFEFIQVRGIVFSTQPLKPDFNRLNPAKGLKRLFSVRMLKETAKNVLKLLTYGAAAYFSVAGFIEEHARLNPDPQTLALLLGESAFSLIFAFTLVALVFAALDQAIARRAFQKQMRMSRSELTREFKEREGEPRLKRRRQKLHAEFARQTKAIANLKGADVLIVNPIHYAVALAYAPATMKAPTVKAKGRNRFALMLKEKARRLNIAIIEDPALARALYKTSELDEEIPAQNFRTVADIYVALRAIRTPSGPLADGGRDGSL